MCKLFKRLICAIFFATIGFLAVSYFFGGDVFRRFGAKVYEESSEVAKKADQIKNATDSAKEAVKKYQKTIKNNKVNVDDKD